MNNLNDVLNIRNYNQNNNHATWKFNFEIDFMRWFWQFITMKILYKTYSKIGHLLHFDEFFKKFTLDYIALSFSLKSKCCKLLLTLVKPKIIWLNLPLLKTYAVNGNFSFISSILIV